MLIKKVISYDNDDFIILLYFFTNKIKIFFQIIDNQIINK
jgi:hypothetical protein